MNSRKQVNEFVEYFGLDKQSATEFVYNHDHKEIEAVLNFLTNYGHKIKIEKNG